MGRPTDTRDRVLGPTALCDGRFRVTLVRGAAGTRRYRTFTTRAAAQRYANEAAATFSDNNSRTLAEALNEYEVYMRSSKLNKANSVNTTLLRLRCFFAPLTLLVRSLSPARSVALYDTYKGRKNQRGELISVDTHRNVLAEAKTFLRWCVERHYAPENALAAVKGTGRRHHGKPQLRIDELRKWVQVAHQLADEGRAGAVAALTALYCGLRSSEIVNRVVRDLDDRGRVLVIEKAKTTRGNRPVPLPAVLQPYLAGLAARKLPSAPLFGAHRREWVLKWTKKICRQAQVPLVCAHSLRGAFSSVAVGEAGLSAELVAALLGHESATTTQQSYIAPHARDRARQAQVLGVLYERQPRSRRTKHHEDDRAPGAPGQPASQTPADGLPRTRG
jgi:integrase